MLLFQLLFERSGTVESVTETTPGRPAAAPRLIESACALVPGVAIEIRRETEGDQAIASDAQFGARIDETDDEQSRHGEKRRRKRDLRRCQRCGSDLPCAIQPCDPTLLAVRPGRQADSVNRREQPEGTRPDTKCQSKNTVGLIVKSRIATSSAGIVANRPLNVIRPTASAATAPAMPRTSDSASRRRINLTDDAPSERRTDISVDRSATRAAADWRRWRRR